MENVDEFVGICKGNYSRKELKLIKRAVDFARVNLEGKKEFCGKSFFDFNIGVGEILVESGLSAEIVASGVLYGVERGVSFEDVVSEFGEEIGEIVFGQLQLRTIKKNNAQAQAEVVRKILITGLSDVRIIFVKLAVKLGNLRIISALKEREQRRIAGDILDLYVPLAMRLGLDYIKNNLEDLAFQIIHPRAHREISNFFKETRKERRDFIEGYIEELLKLLKPKVKLLNIKGRDKQIKSIFDKIEKRGVLLRKQKDHYAIRIIVKSERDCYGVLGILHEEYVPVEGRLKDYINSPKLNGYRSLHTAVKVGGSGVGGRGSEMGSRESVAESREAGGEGRGEREEAKEGKEIEVQIRTEKMDEFAEEGGAAHWGYKKTGGDRSFEKKVGWLKALMESQKNSSNKEFMKNLRLDLFADKIYCYTPKGDVRELAKNATLLDFAYSIHQEVGERAIGGRVNGKFVALKHVLENGVVVDILTNKNQRPRRDWLKFVISAKAKAKIRQGIRRYESIPVPRKSSMKIVEGDDFDSLVESTLFPGAQFSFAKCCYPLPKGELLGVMKSHRRILVHRQDCSKVASNLKNAAPVFWKDKFNRPLNLKVLCKDRSGILADLLNTISRIGFTVRSANAKIVGNGYVECGFAVVPRSVDEVVLMVGRVKKVRSVLQVFFE